MLDYRHKKKNSHWWPIVYTILGVALVFSWSGLGRDFLSGPVTFFAKPLWQAGDNLGVILADQSKLANLSRQDLLVENRKLRKENNRLNNLLSSKNNVESDNLKLRSILGKNQDKTKPTVARVIFLPNFVPYNNLLLDVGRDNGTKLLTKGDLVVADGSVLIGRVAEIGDNYSKAQLISAITNLPVVIGPKNVPAAATGSGSGNFTITLPKDTPISIGDRVTAPLLNNYLIGSVGHIEKLPSRPTQTILVRTPVNLFQLEWVEIYNVKT